MANRRSPCAQSHDPRVGDVITGVDPATARRMTASQGRLAEGLYAEAPASPPPPGIACRADAQSLGLLLADCRPSTNHYNAYRQSWPSKYAMKASSDAHASPSVTRQPPLG